MMKTIRKVDALPAIPHRKRVAAYARVSLGKDAMLHSLSAQISYYNALIGRHIEWEFAGVYADEAATGTRDTRKEFQRMLEDCRAEKIDMVITKSVTRFARNTVTTLESVRELKLLGIDVFFEKEKIHSLSGDGELMLSILASYAQEESRSASENCKWRIRKMFHEGRPNTGHMLGYRLNDGKLCVVPKEAAIVRQIFADYLAGAGSLAIAKRLNADGVPTKHGGPWRTTTVAKLLCNEKYTGNMVLQKTYVTDHISKKTRINHGELPFYYIANSHEAIIPPETFKQAQAEMARRAQALAPEGKPKPGAYPFTGKIRCGLCGGPYRRKHAAAGTKYEKFVWICDTFNTLGKDACSSRQIPERILMDKSAEVLGLSAFDSAVFADIIAEIRVPEPGRLAFVFRGGQVLEIEWHNPSRRESWTDEMKQAARELRQEQLRKQRSLMEKEESS